MSGLVLRDDSGISDNGFSAIDSNKNKSSIINVNQNSNYLVNTSQNNYESKMSQ